MNALRKGRDRKWGEVGEKAGSGVDWRVRWRKKGKEEWWREGRQGERVGRGKRAEKNEGGMQMRYKKGRK